jgi:hypothetical protein
MGGMSVLDAALYLVKSYPGGYESLAPRVGKPASTLRHEVEATGSAKLGLLTAELMTIHSGNPCIVQALAHAAGGVFLPGLPAGSSADDLTLLAVSDAIGEVGKLVTAFSESIADGRVTANELRNIEREALDASGKLMHLLAIARQMHEDGKPDGVSAAAYGGAHQLPCVAPLARAA